METPLLATNLLFSPERPGLIPRPGPMARMGGDIKCSLTPVCTPAGLVTATAADQRDRHSVDRFPAGRVSPYAADNHSTCVWRALKGMEPRPADNSPGLPRSSRPYATEAAPTVLIDSSEQRPRGFFIILGDHHLAGSQATHIASSQLGLSIAIAAELQISPVATVVGLTLATGSFA